MTAHDCYVVIAVVLAVWGFSDTMGTMLRTPLIQEALIGVFLRHILAQIELCFTGHTDAGKEIWLRHYHICSLRSGS